MSPRTLAIFLAALALAFASLLIPGPAGTTAEPKDKEPVGTALYHRDRDHLWNRVHSALLIRVGPDGRAYGEDRLEPLLWLESEHLLKGKSADRAAAVLEEFVREKGEPLIDEPVKRALLQRDLWLLFNWLAKRDAADADQPRQRLGALLAKVIRQLALSPDQIAELPDNYAAAVASMRFPDRFDPDKPDRAYLPADLFKPDGPWVCVGRTDGPTAPRHLDESNPFTNSTFLIFLRLPAGRDATLDFLKRLAAFDKPLYLPNTDEKTKRYLPNLPNPALPQWPKGTEVALVRGAMLIDSKGRIVVSPLTESVQLRVMRTDTPAMTAMTLEGLDRYRGGAPDAQAFAEFRLQRSALFAGEAGALRDVSEERDFKTGFAAHTWDEFTAPGSQPFPERSQPLKNIRASCFGCHRYPGVYSFNSFHGDFPFTVTRELKEGRDDCYVPKSHSLAPMPVASVEQAAVKWKEEQPGWKALRKLLPDVPVFVPGGRARGAVRHPAQRGGQDGPAVGDEERQARHHPVPRSRLPAGRRSGRAEGELHLQGVQALRVPRLAGHRGEYRHRLHPWSDAVAGR